MLKRNLIANYLGQGWVAIMGLAFIPIYIKYLGIESYGLIGLFGVLQAWLTLLDLGMTPTLSREMARYTGGRHSAQSIRDLLRSVEVVAVFVALLLAIGVSFSATWLATSWLRAEKLPVAVVANAFVTMGVVTALRFIEGIYRSSIAGLQRQVLLNVLSSGMATIRAVGAVGALVWFSPTIETFFFWQGITALASLAMPMLTTYSILPKAERNGRFEIEVLRGTWAFAGGMMGITLLALLLTQVDKVILTKLLTLSDYGYYSLASIVAAAIYMLAGPIATAWFPRLSQLHASGDNVGLVRTYHLGAQLISVVVGSAALVIIFNAEILLQLWTQDANLVTQTAPLLRLLVLGNLLNCFMWIPYQSQLAHGWTGLATRINLVAVLVIVPAVLWATPRYGAVGAAWVWVCLNAGYCLVGIHFMYQRILRNEKWSWYYQDILQPLLATTIAVSAIKWTLPNPVSVPMQISMLIGTSVLALTASALIAKGVREQVCTTLIALRKILDKYGKH